MNTELTLNTAPQKMSSLEISKLLNVRHDSVVRTIKRLVDRAVVAFPPTEEKPTDGRTMTVYLLEEHETYIVVAQLSPEFTAALVARWKALETNMQALVTQETNRRLQQLESDLAAVSANVLSHLPRKTGPLRLTTAEQKALSDLREMLSQVHSFIWLDSRRHPLLTQSVESDRAMYVSLSQAYNLPIDYLVAPDDRTLLYPKGSDLGLAEFQDYLKEFRR